MREIKVYESVSGARYNTKEEAIKDDARSEFVATAGRDIRVGNAIPVSDLLNNAKRYIAALQKYDQEANRNSEQDLINQAIEEGEAKPKL